MPWNYESLQSKFLRCSSSEGMGRGWGFFHLKKQRQLSTDSSVFKRSIRKLVVWRINVVLASFQLDCYLYLLLLKG